MLIDPKLSQCFEELGLRDWYEARIALLQQRFSRDYHGDFPAWAEALERIRQCPAAETDQLRDLLMALAPWRKGPFEIGDITIDSEWRSDLKWNRISDAVEPLDGRRVVDVGCGNGYYALRMHDAGAHCVVGVDPTLLYVMQFLAVNHFQRAAKVFVLPLRASELPPDCRAFDTGFSMGVLYHQRAPLEHLREMKGMLRPGGQLVLETLYVPGEESCACTPPDRYARMRNVWLLPTIAELTTWLSRTGFRDIEIVDQSRTTVAEQRTTEWMPFESLAEALDPGDASKTIEGWPAPRRVIVLANAP